MSTVLLLYYQVSYHQSGPNAIGPVAISQMPEAQSHLESLIGTGKSNCNEDSYQVLPLLIY